MKKVLKNLLLAMVAFLGFVACSDDDDITVKVNLEGKWLHMSDNYKELLIVNADHTFLSTGADDEAAWVSVKGKIEMDDDTFTYTNENGESYSGTYNSNGGDETLSMSIGGKTCVYKKMLEEFSLTGTWKSVKTMSFIKAVKDELSLPFGSIVNGEEILPVVKTAEIKGEFIEKAIEAYFRNVEFKDNGEMSYYVIKDGEETQMTKKYTLADNVLTVTGKVGNIEIDNQFMAFQSPSKRESFLLLTKENIADMFVGYALMLREGNVSEGSSESLVEFKKEFMEVFENFATIIYLQKQ